MSLDSPAITELTTESGTFKLLNEWLAKWFDGGTHELTTGVCTQFPKANRAFGQGAPAQPLHNFDNGTDAEIRVVMHSRAESAMHNDTSQLLAEGQQGKLVTDFVIFNFWINAKKPGAGQSDHLAESIAEKLKAILTNPDAHYELAEKGITHIQVQGPPAPVPSVDYSKRLVSCTARLSYYVRWLQT